MGERKGSVVVVSSADELKQLLGRPARGRSDDEGEGEERERVTEHEVEIGGRLVRYHATAGTIDVRLESDEAPSGKLFYIAYTRADLDDPERQPITFCFNGGPGSSAVWLHMGAFGPRRIELDVGAVPRPPGHATDNPHSLLDVTDLVFVDPMSTGFSRPEHGKGREYHGVSADVESVAEFIRKYTTRNGRWGSPKFLAGESYGTTRAASLARHLQQRHAMYLNGIVLLSLALQFQTLVFDEGNVLPYVLALPTYTATAHYHGAIAGDLDVLLPEVESFAYEVYAPALLQGDRLAGDARDALALRLSAYTGLSVDFLQRCNLRPSLGRFCKELLRSRRQVVGRLDSRFTGREADAAGAVMDPSQDPSLHAMLGPYAASFHQDLLERLDYTEEEDEVYEFLNMKVHPWRFDEADNRYLDVTGALRRAMNANPRLRVFVASGLYDLATPFAAAEYSLAQLMLEPEVRANLTSRTYPAGHMMYVHEPSIRQLRDDLLRFFDDAA